MSYVPPASKRDRLFFMDAVRALMMLQVLPMHVAMMYSFGPEWFVSSGEQSWALTFIRASLKMFSMPGFFIIAGYLAHLSLNRRNEIEWLRSRCVRLGVPFLVSMLTLSPIAILAATLAARDGAEGAIENGFTASFVDNLWPIGLQWVGHLWFLPTLLLFSVALFALKRADLLATVFDTAIHWVLKFRQPGAILAVILVTSMLWRVGVAGSFYILEMRFGYEDPLNGFFTVGSWALHVPFFFVGVMLARSRELFKAVLHVSAPGVAILALGAMAFILSSWSPAPEARLIAHGMTGLLGPGITFFALSLAQRHMSARNETVETLIGASYGIYLFHYPIVVLAGVLMREVDLLPLVEFAAITAGAFSLSFFLALGTRRLPALAFAFNGTPLTHTRKRNERLNETDMRDGSRA